MQEPVDAVAVEVGSPPFKVFPGVFRVVTRLEPEDVRPPEPVVGCVGVLVAVRVCGVFAMRGDPEQGAPLSGEHCTQGQQPPNGGDGLEAAMGHLPVVAQRDAEAAGEVIEGNEHPQGGPGEVPESEHTSDVHQGQPNGVGPIDAIGEPVREFSSGQGHHGGKT